MTNSVTLQMKELVIVKIKERQEESEKENGNK